MNYFAARLVRQFKASGTYPSVLPPSPAPGVNLAREREGRGWRGVVVGEPTQTRRREGAAAQPLGGGGEAPLHRCKNTPVH